MIYVDYGILDTFPSFLSNRKLIYKGSVILSDKVLNPNLFNLTYPVICNMEDLKLQKRLNEILRHFLSSFIMDEISLSVDSINPSNLVGNYRLHLNENNLLSIVYEIYFSMKNCNYTLTKLKSLTLNTLTGKAYLFKDLFKTDSDYKKKIIGIIKKEINANDLKPFEESDKLIDSQNFYLTPTDLVLYYQSNSYTECNYFHVPYKEIEDILNPALPIKIYFSYGFNSEVESEIDTVDMLKAALNLFKQAIDDLGPSSPEDAVDLWANGIKTRNGALQYSVLNRELKSKLEKCLRNTSWVTGNSSPWVEDYEIIKNKKIDSITYRAIVSFHLAGNKLDAGYVDAVITIEKKGKHWLITNIK